MNAKKIKIELGQINVHKKINEKMDPLHQKIGIYPISTISSRKTDNLNTSRELRYFNFFCLSHMFDGKGFYINENGVKKNVEKGDLIMTTPKYVHCFGAEVDNFYIEDAITFYGPLADILFSSGLIYNGIINIGTSRQLLPIIDFAENPSIDSQLDFAWSLQSLLYQLYKKRKEQFIVDKYNPIDLLLNIIIANPLKWWSLDEMATFCNLKKHIFRKYFIEHVGIMPKIYLDKIRMGVASKMLLENSKSITEISQLCGYSDPFHFSRRFKEIIGKSPKAFREQLSK